MTINEATEAIYARFKDNWTATTFSTHATFAGEPFEPADADPWVRLFVRETDSRQATLGKIGNRRFRRSGLVMLQIFTKRDQGQQDAEVIAQAFRTLFEGVSFEGLDFTNAFYRPSEIDGKWQLSVAEAEFDYDETK